MIDRKLCTTVVVGVLSLCGNLSAGEQPARGEIAKAVKPATTLWTAPNMQNATTF